MEIDFWKKYDGFEDTFFESRVQDENIYPTNIKKLRENSTFNL